MAKQKPDIVLERMGSHLIKVTNNNTGATTFMWDWDKLLDEVKEATRNNQVRYIEINDKLDAADKEATKLVKLVDEVTKKVKRTRKKKEV